MRRNIFLFSLFSILLLNPTMNILAQEDSIEKSISPLKESYEESEIIDIKIKISVSDSDVRRLSIIDSVPIQAQIIDAGFTTDDTSTIADFGWERGTVTLSADIAPPTTIDITYKIALNHGGSMIIPPATLFLIKTSDEVTSIKSNINKLTVLSQTDLELQKITKELENSEDSEDQNKNPVIINDMSTIVGLIIAALIASVAAAIGSAIAIVKGKKNAQ